MNKSKFSTLSPAAVFLAAACLGVGPAFGQSSRLPQHNPPANDPLRTVSTPIDAKGEAAPGTGVLAPDVAPAPTVVYTPPAPVETTTTTTTYTPPATQATVAAAAPTYDATVAPTPAAVNAAAAASSAPLKYSDKRFVKKVAEDGQLEIALAELAVQRASDSGVRAFAQDIVSDHTAMSSQLAQLATAKSVSAEIAEFQVRSSTIGATASTASPDGIAVAGAPTGRDDSANAEWNDPATDRHYRKLSEKSGAEFDQAFIAAMIADHEDHIAMFDKKAQNASDADVRSFAANNLPKLRQHLERAQQLSSTTGK